MKKIISSLTVCALAVCALASCGDNNTDIVGKWAMNTSQIQGVDGGGFIFSANGNGSVYEDTSSILYFTDNGLNLSGTIVESKYITSSGDLVSVDISGQQILSMTRLAFGSSRYDGKYTLDGGILYDTIVSGMAQQGGFSEDNLNITIEFEGNHSEVVFNDLFTYTVSGSKLTVDGFSGLLGGKDGKASSKFEISGDTLTLKGKNTETLTRVE